MINSLISHHTEVTAVNSSFYHWLIQFNLTKITENVPPDLIEEHVVAVTYQKDDNIPLNYNEIPLEEIEIPLVDKEIRSEENTLINDELMQYSSDSD